MINAASVLCYDDNTWYGLFRISSAVKGHMAGLLGIVYDAAPPCGQLLDAYLGRCYVATIIGDRNASLHELRIFWMTPLSEARPTMERDAPGMIERGKGKVLCGAANLSQDMDGVSDNQEAARGQTLGSS